MQRSPMTHSIKITNPHFKHLRDGERDFAICFDDKDYRLGDLLVFQEVNCRRPKGKMIPTGEVAERKIKHILRKFEGLQTGYLVLGLEGKNA